MKYYKIRKGIVLESICGENLLIATREARGECPYVKQLNSTAAFFWTLLEEGMHLDEMVACAAEHYNVSEERIRPGLLNFLDGLVKSNYLRLEEHE